MHTINRLELERLHTELLGMSVINPTNYLFWINFFIVIGSFAGFLIGVVWFIDSTFGLSILAGGVELSFIQASVLVILPIFALLTAIEIMRMVVRNRVTQFLNNESPDIKLLERLVEAKMISGLSGTINTAINEYISDQQAGV
ncbi:hypothetical protein OTK49_02065 [Vibrio coralliirubri]|uniref:hypothetical protein n=1 Tax=Vibrio coralliirubri TaxID=1516159 RepID=UPI002284C158|nr:hypothetical protein [Vibrio coralliirubri]MCY9861300.1 hypothetical protein [Vibrio coralliirubri]